MGGSFLGRVESARCYCGEPAGRIPAHRAAGTSGSRTQPIGPPLAPEGDRSKRRMGVRNLSEVKRVPDTFSDTGVRHPAA